jgi:hypothetical protein
MNKQLATKIFDALNKNGAELGSASIPIIEQVLESNPIQATERERLLMVEAMMFDHQNSSCNKDILKQSVEVTVNEFLASDAYKSIPPASTFEQELSQFVAKEMERLWEIIPDANEVEQIDIPLEVFMKIRNLGEYMGVETIEDKIEELLKGKQ